MQSTSCRRGRDTTWPSALACASRENRTWLMESDPFLTAFAHGGSFIGRPVLRAHLRPLTAEGGARVLVVDGPLGSGKSYTLKLITHLSRQLQAFSVAAINLEE